MAGKPLFRQNIQLWHGSLPSTGKWDVHGFIWVIGFLDLPKAVPTEIISRRNVQDLATIPAEIANVLKRLRDVIDMFNGAEINHRVVLAMRGKRLVEIRNVGCALKVRVVVGL